MIQLVSICLSLANIWSLGQLGSYIIVSVKQMCLSIFSSNLGQTFLQIDFYKLFHPLSDP